MEYNSEVMTLGELKEKIDAILLVAPQTRENTLLFSTEGYVDITPNSIKVTHNTSNKLTLLELKGTPYREL